MALRKEQVVLIGTAGLLGLFVYGDISSSPRDARPPRPRQADGFEVPSVPDTELALPRERDVAAYSRELFSPPRDTRPLPPLELVQPPRPDLPGLAPPSVPGPAPKKFGSLLRRPAVVTPVGGLFVTASEEDEGEELLLASFGQDEGAGDVPVALDAEGLDDSDLSEEERRERERAWMRLHDWIFADGNRRYGQIRNENRFRLPQMEDPTVLFVEIDPRTSELRFPGQPPVAYTPDRYTEFGFADTIPNQIEVRRMEIGDEVTMVGYTDALDFADFCVEHRLETPRALEVAEEIYRMCIGLAKDDLRPRLGLARCFEAGFRFEEAFAEYEAMASNDHPVVLARLGLLLARFRLFEDARAELMKAERYGRTNWEVHASIGGFLLERGQFVKALEHLTAARRYEPTSPETKRARLKIRTDLGAANLALGRLDEAHDAFSQALQSDPSHQRARAGQIATDLLRTGAGALGSGGSGGAGTPDDSLAGIAEGEEAAGFDLLLARGIRHLVSAEHAEARDVLTRAAETNPLLGYRAWRALSWLAEVTGFPVEAQAFADQAVENNPTDPYSLYQRGRLLAQNDDITGAIQSFRDALDLELDFPDALAALGELHNRLGEYPAAERYFERALAIDPSMTTVHAMRGLNALELGLYEDASASFDAALAQDPENFSARCGKAWAFYYQGDPDEARTRFADVDDLLRRAGAEEEDPQRAYARRQNTRIQDHLEKEVWTDRFDRMDLANGWIPQEAVGPQVTLREGRVWIEGQYDRAGETRMFRERAASQFVAIEARIFIHGDSRARVGLFVSREQYRGGEDQVLAQVAVARHKDGALQTRLVKSGSRDAPYEDVPALEWPADQWVPVSIERIGESKDTRIRIMVDGIPVGDDVAFPTLGSANAPLRIGVFAEGEGGRSVSVEIDDVEVVRRIPR